MIDVTQNMRRAVLALSEAKHRRREGLFAAEGAKCVADTAGAFVCRAVYGTAEWFEANGHVVARLGAERQVLCKIADLRQMTTMQATPPVIAVYEIPQQQLWSPELAADNLVVALDRVQDPGNLGTIMRTADWLGITTIVASPDTVDAYNPKTVQASMGAIARVHIIYMRLTEALAGIDVPVYGTFLDGKNIYTTELTKHGVVVMGNEGRGISAEVAAMVSDRLLIPSWPPERPTSESLNVATATAMVLAEFRRHNY